MPFDAKDFAVTSPELAIVERMMEVLKKPEDWCQGKIALQRAGGVARCLIGALGVAAYREPGNTAHAVENVMLRVVGRFTIADFNDSPTTTFGDIRRVLEATRAVFATA